jgi:hypothetical protein
VSVLEFAQAVGRQHLTLFSFRVRAEHPRVLQRLRHRHSLASIPPITIEQTTAILFIPGINVEKSTEEIFGVVGNVVELCGTERVLGELYIVECFIVIVSEEGRNAAQAGKSLFE